MSAAVSALPSVSAAVVAAIGACWTMVVVLSDPPTPRARMRAATMPPPSRPESRGSRICRMRCSLPAPAKPDLKRTFGLAEGRAEPAQGLLRVGRAHQQLADEHGVDADALEILDLLARGDAGLRDDRLAGGHVGEQLVGALEVDAEVGQVPVVDADDVDVDLEGAVQLGFAVDLHQDVEVDGARLLVQPRETALVERGDDEQHGVGAG